MSDGSLIADEVSTRRPWTGSSIADNIQGLHDAIESGSWVDQALAGGNLALDVVSSALDPFSALLANGLGWAMEYFDPLREMLDQLAGMPDRVRQHAATWGNMADALQNIATDLQGAVSRDVPDWLGTTADAYIGMAAGNIDGISGLAAAAAAMAAATEAAGNLVDFTRQLVRDLIADLVARVIVWAAEAIFVVTIPVVAEQIVVAVVKWAGRILTYTTALVISLTNLTKLLNG
ncbi:WXG100 family type VII secretion target [Actinoplanes sp. CA-030573]|uniref:WXG100 family type VII secretion target n=1 Tax=Actinoplanes sp. CA-030573 TaxID=3239898 RepID=UPI003D89F112